MERKLGCRVIHVIILITFIAMRSSGMATGPDVLKIVGSKELANCYILADPMTKAALVIDPGGAGQKVLGEIRTRNLKVEGIILTHSDPDPTGACAEVQAATQADIWVHSADLKGVRAAYPQLHYKGISKEGLLAVGSFDLEIIHIPGHTPGSICVKYKDRLFTGDTLYLMDLGKGGQPGEIARGIRNKLWPLGDGTKVFPGHGPETSIGFEKKHNPSVAESPKVNAQRVKWLDDFSIALAQAKSQKKNLLLLLTVQQWSCSRGYCASTFTDGPIADYMQNTVNCRIDPEKNPEFKDKYHISSVPALVILDGDGKVLDILEKLPVSVVRDELRRALAGARSLERFQALESKVERTGKESLEMAEYLERHGNYVKAIFYLEKGRGTRDETPAVRMDIEKALLNDYMKADRYDDALKVANRVLTSPAGVGEEDCREIFRKKCALLYKEKDYAGALILLKQFNERYGAKQDSSEAYILMGLCYLGQGQNRQALEVFAKIRPDAPGNLPAIARYMQGYCHLIEQEYSQACESFAALVRDYPDSEYAEKATPFLLKLKDRPSVLN